MRAFFLVVSVCLGCVAPAAAARRTLDLPVRAAGSRVPAPAYAGDVVEIQLAPSAGRVAWRAEPAPRARLGVPALDRAAAELGGARFTPLFHGERPLAAGASGPDLSAFYVVHLPPGVALEDALDRLSNLPDVVRADPVAILPVSVTPDDSLWSSSTWYYQPSRHDIHAPEAWDVTTGDTSIVVGILDTGVVPYHPDLDANLYTNWEEAGGRPDYDDDGNGYADDVHGWDFVSLSGPSEVRAGEDWRDEDNDPNGFCAHGTAVAGLVGALTDNVIGVAGTNWKVRLMPLRVGYSYPGAGLIEGEVRMDFVASAIQYAARMHVDVINCSFASIFDSGLIAALDAAKAAGVVIVTSAGNSGQPNDIATRREVISVASVSSGDVLSSFSNRGPQIDVAAPGEHIATTSMAFWAATTDSIGLRQPGYSPPSVTSGTSFSAPLVAGAAALVQARQRQLGKPPLDPFGVLLRLYDTADDIRSWNLGSDGLYGSGRLNLARALTETAGSRALPLSAKLTGPPAIFRLANGTTRVVIVCDDRSLVCYDGATLDTVWKATLPLVPVSGPAVGPLPGQGIGIFVGLVSGRVAGYLDDGTVLAGGWPKTGGITPMRAGVVVWDIDGDGPPEVLSGSDDGRVWAWHANGDPVTGFPVQVGGGFGRMLPLAVSHEQPTRIAAAADDGNVALLSARGDVLVGLNTASTLSAAPVIATIAGAPAVLFAGGTKLHAIGFDGVERTGFPVTLAASMPSRSEVAVADVDQDGADDFVVPETSPAAIDVRAGTGASLSSLGWPMTPASAPLAPMIVGELNGGGPPELMVLLASGLSALSNAAQPQWGFPKPGEGGTFPALADLDGDGTTNILAGSSTDKVLFCYDAGPGSAGPSNPWPTFRGDFQRTGSARGRIGTPQVDVVAPGGIADLEAIIAGPNTVRLRWTATGDDGGAGRARAYDTREAIGVAIDAGNFASATHVPGGAPANPGTLDSLDVDGVPQGVPVWFALKALDDGGNAGAISNVVSITLPEVSPNPVTDLRVIAVTDSSVTLRWTATGAEGSTGRPQLYLIRASTAALNSGNFDQAPFARDVAATVDAGGTESHVFGSLSPSTRYWFALEATNDASNRSTISNVVQAQTLAGGPIHVVGIALAPGANPSRVPATLYWQAATGASGRQEIGIYDLTGRRIRTIELDATAGGAVQWNGDDDDGRRVPAGLYLLRLRSGDRHVNARLVLLP